MDGDLVNVDELREIAKKYDAVLYLDEAHSLGVYGKDGSGCSFGKKYEKEIVVGTFGKVLEALDLLCLLQKNV